MNSPSRNKQRRPARALARFAVLAVAIGSLVVFPGQPGPDSQGTSIASPSKALGADRSGQRGYPETPVPLTVPAQAMASSYRLDVDLPRVLDGHRIPEPGTIYRNPISGRNEVVVPQVHSTAVLIGDSQSVPADSWPRQALAGLGYKVHFCGYGGTGYVAGNGKIGNYVDALERGDWMLPAGTPGLVVIQGGGNDAGSGASDAQIRANAERLLTVLKSRYPSVRIVMVGTLGKGVKIGGARRGEVDALLGTIAAKHGLSFVSVGDWLTRFDLSRYLSDAVHINSEGRTALGVLLERRLRELDVPDLAVSKKTATVQGPLQ